MNALKNSLKQLFSLDLRSIAFFRILYGILILYDLADRARNLTAHYTDAGVMPREAVLEHDWLDYVFSIHMMNGEPYFQGILFLINALFALFLIVGFKSRIALFVCWIFLHSLHVRNSMITTGGDIVLRMMMFWAIFLPIGKMWSVDSFLNKRSQSNPLFSSDDEAETNQTNYQYFSLATVAFLVQMLSIYFFSVFCKTGDTWLNGEAVYYALMLDQYNTPLGRWLSQFGWLTTGLTYFTLILEKYGLLLFFVPYKWQWFRLLGVALFTSLHVGFIFTLHLGLFPWICIFAWVALWPPLVWNLLAKINILKQLTDKFSHFASQILEKFIHLNWLIPLPTKRWDWGIIGSIIVCFFMISVVWWNMYRLNWVSMPQPLKDTVRYTRINQKWGMFAPNPSRSDGWYVVEGHFSDGINRNLITGDVLDESAFEKPQNIAGQFNTHRWRKFYNNISRKKKSKFRRYFGRYLTTVWKQKLKKLNEGKSKKDRLVLETFVLYFMKEVNKANGEETTPRKVTLWKHWTDKKYKKRFYPNEEKRKEIEKKAAELKKKKEEEKLAGNEKPNNKQEENPEELDSIDSVDNIQGGQPEEKPKTDPKEVEPSLDGADDQE